MTRRVAVNLEVISDNDADTSLDSVIERLQHAKERAEREGISNITLQWTKESGYDDDEVMYISVVGTRPETAEEIKLREYRESFAEKDRINELIRELRSLGVRVER